MPVPRCLSHLCEGGTPYSATAPYVCPPFKCRPVSTPAQPGSLVRVAQPSPGSEKVVGGRNSGGSAAAAQKVCGGVLPPQTAFCASKVRASPPAVAASAQKEVCWRDARATVYRGVTKARRRRQSQRHSMRCRRRRRSTASRARQAQRAQPGAEVVAKQ